MHNIPFDSSDKIVKILPALREHAVTHKDYGKYPILASDFKKLLRTCLSAANLATGNSSLRRMMYPFAPFGKRRPKFIDTALVKFITIDRVPNDVVQDVLYFHLCWTSPLLGKMIAGSVYPFMAARDQVTRDRIKDDLVEVAGKYNKISLQNVLLPMTKHGFITYDPSTLEYSFTFRAVHPLTFLYATYRELERLGLKVMGVHRIDSIMELEYVKWLLLTRPQVVDIAKSLDESDIAGYSFQMSEQIQVKYSFGEFLERLRTQEGRDLE